MKILGIDYGQKKIGLAIGFSGVATPLEELPYKKDHQVGDDAISKINSVIKEEGINTIVIGIPILRGREEGVSSEIKEFSDILLQSNNELNIIYQDESRSTKEAVERLINVGVSKKRRRNDNSQAAAIILERYYESV